MIKIDIQNSKAIQFINRGVGDKLHLYKCIAFTRKMKAKTAHNFQRYAFK